MTFFQRVKRYLFGVLLGVILVYLFFGERTELLTSWMPNERVMKRLRETQLVLPDSMRCQLNCYKLDSAVVGGLLETGDVDFSESDPQGTPILYKVDFDQYEPALRLTFACDDSTSAIVGISAIDGARVCDCP